MSSQVQHLDANHPNLDVIAACLRAAPNLVVLIVRLSQGAAGKRHRLQNVFVAENESWGECRGSSYLVFFWCLFNNDTVAIYRKPDQNIPRPLPLHFESSLPWGQRKCSPAHPGACGHPAGASVVEVRVLFLAGFADKSHHFLLIPYRKLLIIAEALAVWSWPPNILVADGGCREILFSLPSLRILMDLDRLDRAQAPPEDERQRPAAVQGMECM